MSSLLARFQRGGMPAEPSGRYRVLLASEGRNFTGAVIDFARRMADAEDGEVVVLTIARLWGSGLGLPAPGLQPNKREMAQYRANIKNAMESLERAGIPTVGRIVTTRNAARTIVREASRQRCDVIVMGADPARTWLISNMLWRQEPHRVRRRASIPVHLVYDA